MSRWSSPNISDIVLPKLIIDVPNEEKTSNLLVYKYCIDDSHYLDLFEKKDDSKLLMPNYIIVLEDTEIYDSPKLVYDQTKGYIFTPSGVVLHFDESLRGTSTLGYVFPGKAVGGINPIVYETGGWKALLEVIGHEVGHVYHIDRNEQTHRFVYGSTLPRKPIYHSTNIWG